jgi:single-strand DNA-binding protein
MALNKVIEMGRLTAIPELRTTQSGISVTSFTIAVDKAYNKENDHPEANFFDVVAWRNTAEFVTKYFTKGSRIIVEGELQTRNWQDKEGKNHKATEIIASNVSFVDKKAETTEHVEQNYADSNENKADTVDDENLPF